MEKKIMNAMSRDAMKAYSNASVEANLEGFRRTN